MGLLRKLLYTYSRSGIGCLNTLHRPPLPRARALCTAPPPDKRTHTATHTATRTHTATHTTTRTSTDANTDTHTSSNPHPDTAAQTEPHADSGPPPARRWLPRISARTAGVTAAYVAGLGLVALYVRAKRRAVEEEKETAALREAQIGGAFELEDPEGNTVSSEGLLGQWLLVYFGFTHCPDICPDELEKLAEVVTVLDSLPRTPRVQPLFITLDPARDTPKVLAAYTRDFHPRLLGLTGPRDELRKAREAYRVYSKQGPPDADGDYIVDHTIITYLVSPSGQYIDHYNRQKDAKYMVQSISKHMSKHR